MLPFVEHLQESAADTALKKKAEASGVSLEILKKVYRRGVAAWNSGHRPGTTPQQWGMARVNSYITKGKGTYHGADKDLREEEELEEAESWEAGYKRRVVKTTKPEHKEDGYEWRIKGKERPEISIKLYKNKPSQTEFNKQMRRVAGHEFGEEYTIEDSRAKNKAYHKGVSDSTARARVAHWKKMDKLSDRDPRSYEPAPGDATAKTKESVHTKKYREMYGEEGMITFAEYLKEANMVENVERIEEQGVTEGIKIAQQLIFEGRIANFRPPFRVNGNYVDDARGNSVCEMGTSREALQHIADALNAWAKQNVSEAVKGWKHAGRDLMKSRQEKSDAAKEVRLVSLKKDGSESKMHDAEKRFNSEDEARQHHERVKKLNPNRAIAHNLYVGDKVEKLS